MANYNKVLLMGNLTRDPELRSLPSGMPVVNIGLAVNDRFKNKQTDQWEERPNFFDCTAFGRTAEVINQYFQRGKPIFVEGKLRHRTWEDRESGQKRSKVEVVIDNFEFVGGQGPGGEGGGPPRQQGGYSGGGGNYGNQGGGYGGGRPQPQQQPAPDYNDYDQSAPPMGGDDDIPF